MSNQQLRFDDVKVGDALPPLTLPPVSRTDLALYCGASGDHNPIHVDIDYAKAAGMPDVFAHGMLSMAWLARLLTNWAPQTALRQYGVRFVAITHVGDEITCSGEVAEKTEAGGERRVKLLLHTRDAKGETKLSGEAWLALP
jgi:acyl dehydratase